MSTAGTTTMKKGGKLFDDDRRRVSIVTFGPLGDNSKKRSPSAYSPRYSVPTTRYQWVQTQKLMRMNTECTPSKRERDSKGGEDCVLVIRNFAWAPPI